MEETFPQSPETMKMADFSILTCLHPYERVFLKAPRGANKKKKGKRKKKKNRHFSSIHMYT